MNKVEKVTALIYHFQLGTVKNISKLVAENFIQHNQKNKSGRDGLIGEIEARNKIGTPSQIRILAIEKDGDYAFAVSVLNLGQGEILIFDIFKFNKENKISDHWDNRSEVNKFNFLIKTEDFSRNIKVTDEEVEKNKKLVANFFEEVAIKNNRLAAEKYYDIQEFRKNSLLSSPMYEISVDKNIIKKMFFLDKVHFILGGKNLVLLAASGRHNDDNIAYYALFILQNNRIIRHYDNIEKISSRGTDFQK